MKRSEDDVRATARMYAAACLVTAGVFVVPLPAAQDTPSLVICDHGDAARATDGERASCRDRVLAQWRGHGKATLRHAAQAWPHLP